MKFSLFLAFVFSSLQSILAIEGIPAIVRVPLVTPEFASKIKDLEIANPDHIILNEYEWSNPNSAFEGKTDYFVVNSNGHRILSMSPIPLTSFGIWNTPVFTDVNNGEVFIPSLQIQDNRNGINDWDNVDGILDNFFHYGEFTIGNERVYVVVCYLNDLSHPMVILTWGEESTIMDPGVIWDFFIDSPTTEPFTKTELLINDVVGEEGFVDGIYLFVDTPKDFRDFTLEKTSSGDMNSWSALIEPYMIYGQTVIYYVPKEDIGFFRVME
jgi:hypothetical protein